jgi:hypothetical protein
MEIETIKLPKIKHVMKKEKKRKQKRLIFFIT